MYWLKVYFGKERASCTPPKPALCGNSCMASFLLASSPYAPGKVIFASTSPETQQTKPYSDGIDESSIPGAHLKFHPRSPKIPKIYTDLAQNLPQETRKFHTNQNANSPKQKKLNKEKEKLTIVKPM
jgi:hypothetical protein